MAKKKRYSKPQTKPATQAVAPLAIKSLKLHIPGEVPYEKQENWFETFVGRNIFPLIKKYNFRRFFFTRYGAAGNGHMLFRFEIRNYAQIEKDVEALIAMFGPPDGLTDYDPSSDIGQGQNSRSFSLCQCLLEFAQRLLLVTQHLVSHLNLDDTLFGSVCKFLSRSL